MEKSKLNKIIKEVKTYPLLFDMDRLEFIRQLMSLHIKVEKDGWIEESKEYRELMKYRAMDNRFMIESGLIDYEVKQRVDKFIDKCITDLLEGNNE